MARLSVNKAVYPKMHFIGSKEPIIMQIPCSFIKHVKYNVCIYMR